MIWPFKKKTPTPWIEVYQNLMTCEGCDKGFIIPKSNEKWVKLALMKGFQDEHRRCKPKN